MRILIADAFPEEFIKQVEKTGNEVTYNADWGADDLPRLIKGINILVVRSTKVTAKLVDESNTLSLVIRAGSGVNTIDLEACARKGIFVSNCPGLNSVAVAELTMAHILSLDRNIPDCVADLRNGKWNKGKYAKMSFGLKGRHIGIIGFGSIGREVAKRARAFDMNLLVYDPFMSRSFIERNEAVYCADVGELCEKSDIVTIHVPFTPDTEKLLNEKAFSRMKKGAFLINTSRGSIIDEKAFLKAAEEKDIRGGFDVFSDEPASKECDYSSKLTQSPHVYGTHHIGASTIQAQIAVAEEVFDLIRIYTEGGHLKNSTNTEKKSRAKAILSIRHYDRVGVLAEIFRILKEENINVEDMENIILQGQKAACARIQISTPLSDVKKISEDAVIANDIIHVEMFDLS